MNSGLSDPSVASGTVQADAAHDVATCPYFDMYLRFAEAAGYPHERNTMVSPEEYVAELKRKACAFDAAAGHAPEKRAVPKDVVYVLEWGAISLPLGHPSRITCMEVHYTAAEAAAEAEMCDFDCRVFPITIPDPSTEPGYMLDGAEGGGK